MRDVGHPRRTIDESVMVREDAAIGDLLAHLSVLALDWGDAAPPSLPFKRFLDLFVYVAELLILL